MMFFILKLFFLCLICFLLGGFVTLWLFFYFEVRSFCHQYRLFKYSIFNSQSSILHGQEAELERHLGPELNRELNRIVDITV